MIFFLIISTILSVVVGQQAPVFCRYYLNGQQYACDLTINNPDGFNNFTEVGGIHLEGYSNADVDVLFRVNGYTANVPSIICETFTNLLRMELYRTAMTRIDDNSFGGCSILSELVLSGNAITSISANAFSNLDDLDYLNLESNFLSTLPETLFVNLQSLTTLDLNENRFENIPAGLFRPLTNLQYLFLGYSSINEINTEWFETNSLLSYLHLSGNRITLSAHSFRGLEGLDTLNLAYNGIDEIPDGAFAHLTNLRSLFLYGNNIPELNADSFEDLANLEYLDLSENEILAVHDGAFNGLTNLETLYLSNNRLRTLHADSFAGLENLERIYFSFNDIEELPQGVFVPLESISHVGLWLNRLKTLRRNSFGTLSTIQTLDLDSNVLNAVDRGVIDEAMNLNTLYFMGNLCASNFFPNFLISRPQHLPVLERCFSNMRYIIETTTEGDDAFSFFDGPDRGIALRVNSDNEVHIALTPFAFEWTPMIEIFIGAANNTRSIVRINQDTNVVTIPTPNIIMPDQWNDFRITWENQVVLVYGGNDTFPFIAYTMLHFFPVNFYGLRAVETSASWTVQPFDW